MQENLNEIYSFLKENNALSLVLYKILGKGSMRRAHAWYDGNIVRYLAPSDMRSQRISDFLKGFGDESLIRSFYATYLKPPESGISIDTTALPNQADLDITHCGYSSETMEEEIKCTVYLKMRQNTKRIKRYFPPLHLLFFS